jgi:putative transcriptional regulator
MRNRLREICAENNMTLQELGARLGRSKQYMSELGRGNIRLTYEMAVKIAQVFDTTPDKLFLPYESNNMGLGNGTNGK